MSGLTTSRRSFLAMSAATATLAATTSTVSFSNWAEAQEDTNDAEVKISSSTCNACSNKCGMLVYSKNGRLWKVKGEELHPYSKGTLCARGHGYATIGYTDGRITEPLKRNEEGGYDPISWEQAYQEIGDKVKEILAKHGPGAIAAMNDPRPSGQFYTKRFINALGSPNYYTHGSSCNLSCNSAYKLVLGGNSAIDLANARCVMFIGRSYADGVRPSSANSLAQAAERGCHIITVDPRFNAMAHMADDWVAIRPGTDLALILGMSNVLVRENLYDADFIANHTDGFEEYEAAIRQYTPEWASEITGIEAERIENLARTMASYAPASSIELSWRAAIGCAYENSIQTARALALFNALLGSYGKKGGQFWGLSPKLGPLEAPKFAELPKIDENLKQYGSKEFPLALKSMGSASNIANGALKGDIKAVFAYNSNPIMAYGNHDAMVEAYKNLDLFVSIDIQMSESAIQADYVLPDTSYIERKEVPATVGGKSPVVDCRLQGIDVIHPNTRPVDQIYAELAEACGIGQYFNFTVDDVIDAQLAPFPNREEIKTKGIAKVMEGQFKFPSDEEFKFKTEDGILHFADDVWIKGGLGRNIEWIPPRVMPDTAKGEFRLIGGKQAIHTHTSTTNVPLLIQITKDYDLERVWVNKSKAQELGIEDGDLIEISSPLASTQVRCHTTERLHPECIWNPTHYGVKSPFLKAGTGLGIAAYDHTPFEVGKHDGALCSQEAIVTIKKVGA
ncbi:MAG: molybdopterin-dependent oxidoreductase [Coriobacteriia bacterium]|nr:molybdopterin-dependent oxidoreductase [Coriobacteriia bacterium]